MAQGLGYVDVAGSTLGDAMFELDQRVPGIMQRLCPDGRLLPGLQISVDHAMSHRGLQAKLMENSEVHFLPLIGGG